MKLMKVLASVLAMFMAPTLVQAQVIGLATNPQGSVYYSVGAAIAGVMQNKAKFTTRVQPMSGSSAYAALMNRGEIEFGLMNALDVVNAYKGAGSFKGRDHPDLRLVGVMFPLATGIGVPNDSPVKSIKDLNGLRMPSQFTAQSAALLVQEAMLATGGLSTSDMKPFPVANLVKGMEALGSGKVDAASFTLGAGTSQEVNIALASRGGLRFLSLTDDPEATSSMRRVFPSTYLVVFQPSGAYPGVIGPTRLMVYSAFLMTNKHVSADVVYKVTKELHDNKEMLASSSAALKGFDPAAMSEANPVPYHPGAEKFYKENAQWPPKQR